MILKRVRLINAIFEFGMMMIKKEFGRVLSETRKSENKVQEEVADYSTYSNRYIQQMEAGQKQPTLTTLFKLAVALETTPDKLIMPVWEEWVEQGYPDEEITPSDSKG